MDFINIAENYVKTWPVNVDISSSVTLDVQLSKLRKSIFSFFIFFYEEPFLIFYFSMYDSAFPPLPNKKIMPEKE